MDTIILKWVEKGKKHQVLLNREKMLMVFEGIALGFSDDNEISKKLIEIIPVAEEIKINKDLNSTQDVPCITYKVNGQRGMIKIIRYHKIVWAILDRYCSEKKKK